MLQAVSAGFFRLDDELHEVGDAMDHPDRRHDVVVGDIGKTAPQHSMPGVAQLVDLTMSIGRERDPANSSVLVITPAGNQSPSLKLVDPGRYRGRIQLGSA